MELYKQKREELQDLQFQLNSLEKTLSIVTSDESTRMQAIQVLELKLATVKKELNDQALKRERASKMYIKLSKEYTKLHPVNEEDPKENEELTDIKVRAVKERCNMIMTEMEKIQESHPELSDKITDYYQKVYDEHNFLKFLKSNITLHNIIA